MDQLKTFFSVEANATAGRPNWASPDLHLLEVRTRADGLRHLEGGSSHWPGEQVLQQGIKVGSEGHQGCDEGPGGIGFRLVRTFWKPARDLFIMFDLVRNP